MTANNTEKDQYSHKKDSAIASLQLMLGTFGINISMDELNQRYGKYKPWVSNDIVAYCKNICKKRVKKTTVTADKLTTIPLPVIIKDKYNNFKILISVIDNQFTYLDPLDNNKFTVDSDQYQAQFTNEIILIANKEDTSDLYQSKFGLFWFFRNLFYQFKPATSQILVSAFVVQLFALVTPLFTMVIIDKVFSSSGFTTLDVLIIGLFLIAIFDLLIGIFRRYVLTHVTNKLDVALMARLYKHLTYLPIEYYSSKQTGDLTTRVKEVESIRQFITGSGFATLIDIPFLFVFIFVMSLFSITLTFIVCVALVLMMLLYGFFGNNIKGKLTKKHQMQTDNQSMLVESVTAMETIKSMSLENQMQQKWEEQIAKQSKYAFDTDILTNNITQISSFINKVTIGLCLWVAAIAVLDGNMTAGQLVAFNMLVGRVMGPAQRVAQMLQQLYQIKIYLKRVSEILETPQEDSYEIQKSNLPSMAGEILLKNVDFKYEGTEHAVLYDINLHIRAGEIVGIIGSSGAGKTTLVKLIQRLLKPTTGKILIDSVSLSSIDPIWLRSRIGIVLQDNVLFNMSIKENITLADPNISMDQLIHACTLAGADEFIRSLPESYDTPVGEKGQKLSTGERQRIAIARALVTNPDILIFDEATSALDYESEAIIQKQMQSICKNRTVIIIAHRLSTLRITDRIIALEHGKIVQDGNPYELLNQTGRYKQLIELHEKTNETTFS